MTVEEKAEKYAMEFVKSKYSDIYSVDAKFAFNAVKHDWLAGYAEAMRLRESKDELPEEAGCDFCRDEQGYTIGNMYVCDKCGRQVP